MTTSEETSKRKKRRRLPRGGPSKTVKKRLHEKLLAMRAAILQSSQDLADEALKKSGQDGALDHMADHGSDNFEQDFSLALLEGEQEILQAIEDAIEKLNGQDSLPYGACEACMDDEEWDPQRAQPWIPVGRLEVLPYARLCVFHQEALEED
jgi:RNA polymerase-binding transcription factor DksA